MSILWFCAILQLAFSFSVTRRTNIFLNENQKEQMIESPENPWYSLITNTFYKWVITALPKHTIELYCDDILLSKTDNCSKGSLIISDHERMEKFCELRDNLKRKSIKNKIEIQLWKSRFTISNFRCRVQLIPPPPPQTITPEETDGSDYDTNLKPVSTTCPCGWRNKFNEKIVGGEETHINQYPFMAVLVDRISNAIICGATIITPLHLLTAAHCKWWRMSAIVGEHDFDQSDETNATVKIDVLSVIRHNAFDIDRLEYDIAIVVLTKEINFNRDVGPVCLPTKLPNVENQFVKALGWGVINPDKRISSQVLREVNLKVINTVTCSTSYKEFLRPNSRTQFCTFASKKDTCQGDSGGPLLWLDPELNRYTQIGIVSYGKQCATQVPGVNTDVYYFMDWIRSIVIRTSENRKIGVCMKEK